MWTHTGALTVEVVRADVVDAGRVDVVVSLTAGHDVLVDGGEAELVRTLALTRRERNRNGAGSTVSRRTGSVLGRVDLGAPGSMATGETRRLRAVVPVPGSGEASIAGELVQQDYTVRVRFRMGEQRLEATRAVHVPLAPAPSSLLESPAVVDHAEVAVLAFEDVPSHQLHGGVPVRGTVTVSPSVAGRARCVRVDLLMIEHVSATPGEPLQEDLDASTVVASVTPVDHVELRPDRVVRVPFTLPVPDRLPAPTVRMPDSRCAGSCRPSSTGRCGVVPGSGWTSWQRRRAEARGPATGTEGRCRASRRHSPRSGRSWRPR